MADRVTPGQGADMPTMKIIPDDDFDMIGRYPESTHVQLESAPAF